MQPRRVFLSSVIRDFTAERQAAREAVLLLRECPVMAEDFGARSLSPRHACLEAVRTCDVFVAIFGARYGTVISSSGISVSEEEFLEARRLGKDMLCFVQAGIRSEAPQASLVQRVQDYESGLLTGRFDSAALLKDLLTRSLHDLLWRRRPSQERARQVLNALGWGERGTPASGPSLGVALVPGDSAYPGRAPRRLEHAVPRSRLLQAAFDSRSAVFDRRFPVETHDQRRDCVVFRQTRGPGGETARIIEDHAQGALVLWSSLSSRASRRLLVDQAEVEEFVARALRLASVVYATTVPLTSDRRCSQTVFSAGKSVSSSDTER